MSYIFWPKELNYCKCASVQTVLFIELKFIICIDDHRPTYYNYCGKFRIKGFFTWVQKRTFIHYTLWSQIIKNMLLSKRSYWLSSYVACESQIAVFRTIFILVCLEDVAFLQKSKIWYVMAYEFPIFNGHFNNVALLQVRVQNVEWSHSKSLKCTQTFVFSSISHSHHFSDF